MSAKNKNNTQTLNDNIKKCSDEKQKIGLKDEDEEKSDEEKNDKDNMEECPETADVYENYIKLTNERKQNYKDYLSKKNDNFSKSIDYLEKVNPDTFLRFGETEDKRERHKNVIVEEKRQIAHDQLDDDRKQEHKTDLSKTEGHFSKPDEYFEKVNPDTFLGFGETQDRHERHKNVILEEKKKQIAHDQLDDDRKQEYETYLSKADDHFSEPDEYFEKVNPDTFLDFGETQDRHERHKNVILEEKRQISYDKLDNERKQDYQTYLSKTPDDNFSKPDEYFEKVNPDSFLEFGEDAKKPTRGTHGRKNMNLNESNETFDELQNSLQQASISPYGSSNFERHNQIEEAKIQMNREHNLQNFHDERRRQHEQYSQELSQQIEDKKQYNIVKANREQRRHEDDEKRRQCEEYYEKKADDKQRDTEMANCEQLEVEAHLLLHITDQITDTDTQINREIIKQDKKNLKNEEYVDELCQQIEDNKQRKIATVNQERLKNEALDRYEDNHRYFN